MAVVFTIFSLILVLCLFLYIYIYVNKTYDYWKKRNVPHLKPSFPFGNYKDYIFNKKFSAGVAQEICQKFPDKPYVGAYYGTDPVLIIQDPQLIKLVMVKDFYYFNHREVSKHTHKEVITKNIFFNGGDTWRVLRQNFTGIFTSAKIKSMFYLIDSSAKVLKDVLKRELGDNKTIEIKSLLSRYTIECIGSCVFGIDANSLQEKWETNPFLIISNKIFDKSYYGGFRLAGRSMWPDLFYKLGFTLFDKKIGVFFKKLLMKVFESRNYKKSSKNDLVDLIMGWKDNAFLEGDKVSNMKTGQKDTIALKIDDDLRIGQCISFFAAGFQMPSTTTSFMLYELAKNKEAQSRVIEEIDDFFIRHNDKIEYECINEMPYVQACVDETLRLYPPFAVLTREVTEDYILPTGLHLEEGTRIHIPVYHIQHCKDYFSEPEEFRPERFFGAEKKNIKPFTYLPFGEGPRTCIGLRFAKMPIAAAVLTIFKDYTVELADGMPREIHFQPHALVAHATSGIHLKFVTRYA